MAYNPSLHTASNKSYATRGKPIDARTYYFDNGGTYRYRPYRNVAEVLAYLPTTDDRRGNFEIVINTGGTLGNDGYITGGVNELYWFKDGYADGDLVRILAVPDLQNVTNKGNFTNKAIQVTGNGNIDLTKDSAGISNSGGQSSFFDIHEGAVTTSMTLKDEAHDAAGANFNSRVEMQPAINDLDAVVLGQLNDALEFKSDKTKVGYLISISEIRALIGDLPAPILYTTDFNQEGNWYYDENDTTSSDNTGTILVTADGKRIKRIIDGDIILLDWFFKYKKIDVKYSGSSTSGSNIFNVPGASLDQTYVNGIFSIRGANTSGGMLYGTIREVLSATSFRGSVNAVNTVTNQNTILGGVDITSNFNSAVDFILTNGGGKLVLSGNRYWINGTVTIKPTRGTPLEIDGNTIMSLQDGFGGETKGSCILRTEPGTCLFVNQNSSGLGILTAPLMYTAFSIRNLNFINWSDNSTTAMNVFRTRGVYENLSSYRMDRLIRQDSFDTSGNATYNDNSVYNNIRINFSKLGGLKLNKADGSRVCGVLMEGADTGAIFAVDVFNSPAISIDNVVHGAPGSSTSTSGSALIKLSQCFGARISNVHAEDVRLEAIFNIENSGATTVTNLFTYLNNQTCFKLVGLIKGLTISAWYSYEDRPAGTYDIDFGTNNANTDITWSNIELFSNTQVAGALRRDFVFNNLQNRGKIYYEVPVEYTSDLNSILGYRQFRSKTGCLNLPSGLSFVSGVQYLMNDDENFAFQWAEGGTYFYTRYKSSGVWGSWNRTLNTIDLATINSDINNRLLKTNISDFNSPTDTVLIRGAGSALNAPYVTTSFFNGIHYVSAGNPDFAQQIVVDTNNGVIYTRRKTAGVWAPWLVETKFTYRELTANTSITPGNISETIVSKSTTGDIVTILLTDATTFASIFKTYKNDSDFIFTIQPGAGVTIDGVTANYILPNRGDYTELVSTAPNTWKTIYRTPSKVNNTSTTMPTKAYLNTTYPPNSINGIGTIGFEVSFPNVTDGSLIAKKIDNLTTGDWLLVPAPLAN